MEYKKLNLYRVIPKYIKALQDESNGGDKRVYGKDNRPFIGIVVVCNGQKYCVPLTSVKEKFMKMKGAIDFGLIKINNEIVAGIEYSRMIPVEEHFLRPLDTIEHAHDTDKLKTVKKLRRAEIERCATHNEEITNKVNVLYNTYTSNVFFKHRKNCLDFPQLERIGKTYCKEHPQQHNPQSNRRR